MKDLKSSIKLLILIILITFTVQQEQQPNPIPVNPCGNVNPCTFPGFSLQPPFCCCGPSTPPNVGDPGITKCKEGNSLPYWPPVSPFSYQTVDCKCCFDSPMCPASMVNGVFIKEHYATNPGCCCNERVDCPVYGKTNWEYKDCKCPDVIVVPGPCDAVKCDPGTKLVLPYCCCKPDFPVSPHDAPCENWDTTNHKLTFWWDTQDCACCTDSPCQKPTLSWIPKNKNCCCNDPIMCENIFNTSNWDYEDCNCKTTCKDYPEDKCKNQNVYGVVNIFGIYPYCCTCKRECENHVDLVMAFPKCRCRCDFYTEAICNANNGVLDITRVSCCRCKREKCGNGDPVAAWPDCSCPCDNFNPDKCYPNGIYDPTRPKCCRCKNECPNGEKPTAFPDCKCICDNYTPNDCPGGLVDPTSSTCCKCEIHHCDYLNTSWLTSYPQCQCCKESDDPLIGLNCKPNGHVVGIHPECRCVCDLLICPNGNTPLPWPDCGCCYPDPNNDSVNCGENGELYTTSDGDCKCRCKLKFCPGTTFPPSPWPNCDCCNAATTKCEPDGFFVATIPGTCCQCKPDSELECGPYGFPSPAGTPWPDCCQCPETATNCGWQGVPTGLYPTCCRCNPQLNCGHWGVNTGSFPDCCKCKDIDCGINAVFTGQWPNCCKCKPTLEIKCGQYGEPSGFWPNCCRCKTNLICGFNQVPSPIQIWPKCCMCKPLCADGIKPPTAFPSCRCCEDWLKCPFNTVPTGTYPDCKCVCKVKLCPDGKTVPTPYPECRCCKWPPNCLVYGTYTGLYPKCCRCNLHFKCGENTHNDNAWPHCCHCNKINPFLPNPCTIYPNNVASNGPWPDCCKCDPQTNCGAGWFTGIKTQCCKCKNFCPNGIDIPYGPNCQCCNSISFPQLINCNTTSTPPGIIVGTPPKCWCRCAKKCLNGLEPAPWALHSDLACKCCEEMISCMTGYVMYGSPPNCGCKKLGCQNECKFGFISDTSCCCKCPQCETGLQLSSFATAECPCRCANPDDTPIICPAGQIIDYSTCKCIDQLPVCKRCYDGFVPSTTTWPRCPCKCPLIACKIGYTFWDNTCCCGKWIGIPIEYLDRLGLRNLEKSPAKEEDMNKTCDS